jgi:hypothetical protein
MTGKKITAITDSASETGTAVAAVVYDNKGYVEVFDMRGKDNRKKKQGGGSPYLKTPSNDSSANVELDINIDRNDNHDNCSTSHDTSYDSGGGDCGGGDGGGD